MDEADADTEAEEFGNMRGERDWEGAEDDCGAECMEAAGNAGAMTGPGGRSCPSDCVRASEWGAGPSFA